MELEADEPITETTLASIKYLYVSTSNDYELAFGKEKLPMQFEFSNAGDEWWSACIVDTGRFQSFNEQEDYEGLANAEDSIDIGMLVADGFAYLTNLETVRLMSCEVDIHSLKSLESLANLKVLEISEVKFHGLDKLIGLDKLCIWTN